MYVYMIDSILEMQCDDISVHFCYWHGGAIYIYLYMLLYISYIYLVYIFVLLVCTNCYVSEIILL